MKIERIITGLSSLGVELSLDGDSIIVSNSNRLTQPLRMLITKYKQDIVTYLQKDHNPQRGQAATAYGLESVNEGLEEIYALRQKLDFPQIDLSWETMENLKAHHEVLKRCLADSSLSFVDALYPEGEPEHFKPPEEKKGPKPRCHRCDSFTQHTRNESSGFSGWLTSTCNKCGERSYIRPQPA